MNGLKKVIFVLFIIILCGSFALGTVQTASAAWPTKPITLYIPFAAGGSMDASVRALAPAMEKALGQSIVLINKGGGSGTVALGILANAKPDGYTLSAGATSGIFKIPVQSKVPYKPLASFTNIFAYAAVTSATVVRADSVFKTWKDLIEYARQNPGQVKYSSTGFGSPTHVAMEVAAEQEGIKWIHIPYQGTMPGLTAVLGGHVQACSAGPKFVGMVHSGQMRILAVHTQRRMAEFPNAPTMLELGVNYFNDTMFSIFGPAGMDMEVVNKIEDAVSEAVDSPLFLDFAKNFTTMPIKMRQQEYTKLLEDGWLKQVKIFQKLGRIKEPATAPR